MPITTPRLELRQIVKSFPGCLANDRIDLTVGAGEIHALLGENGAGKSTLVKIIYGVLAPDSGEIRIAGEVVAIRSPAHARALGIGMVFQHFSLFEALTVADNIALGSNTRLKPKLLRQRVDRVASRYGLALELDRAVHRLSVGEKQRIEIVRCLLQEPRLLIMDEPTSVLTPQEVETLFTTLRTLAAEGCSILYISHKLEEVQALCQQATVLRDGRKVAACKPSAESPRSLAQLMVGSELHDPSRTPLADGAPVLLQVDRLALASDDPFGIALRDVSLQVRAGEIVGIAGVAGNGQAELLAALSGERPVDAEMVTLQGRPIGQLEPKARRLAGIGSVPENRLGHAAVPELNLADNALLTGYLSQPFLCAGFIRGARVRAFAKHVVDRFDVRAAGVGAAAQSLSGGNLQKYIVGREIALGPRVLVVSQPTWGVDAGAELAIHQALHDLAAAGAGIIVISQDLDELLAISHRVGTLYAGELSQLRPVDQVTREEIGLAMSGSGSRLSEASV